MDADLIARDTKNRVIEGIVERLLNLTSQVLWTEVRRECILNDPSRIELMLDIRDWIIKAIAERNTDKAIHELEHHQFDIQIDQIQPERREPSRSSRQIKPDCGR